MSEEVKKEGEFKIKTKPKKLNKKENVTKVELKTPEKEVPKEDLKVSEIKTDTEVKELKVESPKVETTEAAQDEKVVEEAPIVELNKEDIETPRFEEPVNNNANAPELPENVEKLVSFMKETGGNVEDYVRLNTDYSTIDENELLRLYYAKTKPHLNSEEIDFVLEDSFSFDENYDEDRSIKKKKLAYKEEVAKARGFLDELKSKYYDEIKLRPGVTQDQQKAMDFFNKYNNEQEIAKQRHDTFSNNTKKFFGEEFKGFEFDVSDKKFRYNVKNADNVASNQSNLNNFVEKFFNESGNLKNYNDYHKAIYTAENADNVASHFYEQGKADAIKDMMAKSKNVDNKPRTTSTGDVFINGLKVKAVDGVDSSNLKLRINKK